MNSAPMGPGGKKKKKKKPCHRGHPGRRGAAAAVDLRPLQQFIVIDQTLELSLG